MASSEADLCLLTALSLAENPIPAIDHVAHILSLLKVRARGEAPLEAVDERVAVFTSRKVE